MKKKNIITFISATALCVAMIFLGEATSRADTATSIKSHGNIIVSDDIAFYAEDFATLETAIETGKEAAYDKGYEAGKNEATVTLLTTIKNISSSTVNVNISDYYTGDIAKLTKNDFIIAPTAMYGSVSNASSNQNCGASISPSYTYDPSTGILTVTGLQLTQSPSGIATFTTCAITQFNLYLS